MLYFTDHKKNTLAQIYVIDSELTQIHRLTLMYKKLRTFTNIYILKFENSQKHN